MGTRLSCLLDTGSNLTALQLAKYEALPVGCRPPLEGGKSFKVADGHVIRSHGHVTLPFKIGDTEYIHCFVVAELEDPVMLGMDFLRAHGGIVFTEQDLLVLGGQYFKCQRESKLASTFKVTLEETVVVPPLSEMLLPGRIEGRPNYTSAIIEPNPKWMNKEQLLMGKMVVDPSGGTVPVRVVNLQDRPNTLYGNSIIATCEPVSSVVEPQNSNVHSTSGCTRKIKTVNNSLPDHMKGLWESMRGELNAEQQNRALDLLIKYSGVFAKSKHDLGHTTIVKHCIETGDATPVRLRPYRLPLSKRTEAVAEVQRMEQAGLIEPSNSPWAAPVVLVLKRDLSYRFCLDYRRLNAVTKKDSYPLPRIDDSIDALRGSQWFSTLDLASGYWQVGMDERDREKTAFSVGGLGLYQFRVMPMGLVGAPATFERLMERVLAGLHWETCLVYLDDIICFAHTFDTHLDRLGVVLERLQQAGMKISPEKCQLFQREVTFLGHVVSKDGVTTDPKKVASVREWPEPKNLTQVRSFVGFCSYYRRFVKNFAEVAKPLHRLTEAGRPFLWTEECRDAFSQLRNLLTSTPILGYPVSGQPFVVDCDASGVGLGAVLSQQQEGQEKVIGYYSRTLSKEERRYCVTRRELLAVVEALKHFHHYVYGVHCLVRSDHGSLRWLLGFKNPEGQMARWIERLGNYDIEIQHRPGVRHLNADGLSRRPCGECAHCDRKDLNENSVGEVTVSCRVMRTRGRSQGDDRQSPDAQGPDAESGPEADPSQAPAEGSDPPKFPGEGWIEPWARADIADWQRADPHVKQVLTWCETGSRPAWNEIQAEGSILREYWSRYNQLEIHEGILHRKCMVDDQSGELLRMVAPPEIRTDIFRWLHNDRTAAHMGIRKTLFNVRRRFWWPGLRHDVERWCQRCRPCQFRNLRAGKKRSRLHQEPVGSPWERIAMDILSIPTESERGNTCILVVADYFSKWTEAFALPDHQALTVADVLVTEMFMRFGVPRVIHSDQGREFQSELMKGLSSLLGARKTQTAPYHPQSDGLVERMNRTVISMLSKICDSDHENWDDHLPYVMCAYRSTVNESTGCSPNSVIFGREITMPVDLMYTSPTDQPGYNCPVEYVEWVQQALNKNYELARISMQRSALRQKQYYDQRAQSREFKVGDWVLRLYPPLSQDKLNYKFIGPFLITTQLGEVTFLVQKEEGSRCISVHADDLKLYRGDDTPQSWLVDTVDTSEGLEKSTQCDLLTPLIEEEMSSSDEESLPDYGGPPVVPVGVGPDLNPPPRPGGRVRRPPKRFGWEDD